MTLVEWMLACVVAVIVFGWALETLATVLDLRALSPIPPPAFREAVDAATYRTMQEYARARARLGLLRDAVLTAGLLAVVLAGGLGWLDRALRATGLEGVWLGLAYFAVLTLAWGAAGLPFGIWRTFVIEERFGFNTTTPRRYVLDLVKGTLLGAAIGGPLLAALLWSFARLGAWAWPVTWTVVAVVSLILQYIAPIWIMPLFNRFTPLPEGELRTRLEELAARHGFSLSGIFVMDASTRSRKLNAFFTGFGSKRRIVLFDTLLRQLDPAQVTAVMAHEIGHAVLGHIVRLTATSLASTALLLGMLTLFLQAPDLQAALGVTQPSVHAGLTLFLLVYGPISLATGVAAAAISRRYEYAADRFATADGLAPALRQALVNLGRENLANLTPHPLTVWLHASHPPLAQRIAALRE